MLWFQNLTTTNRTYQALVKPILSDFSNDIKLQLATIELLDDNSLWFNLQDVERQESYSEEFLRSYRSGKTFENTLLKLDDVLEVGAQPG